MGENPQSRFIELRQLIRNEFQRFEDISLRRMHPNRNKFYGATDALLDTIKMLMCAKELHIGSTESGRNLIAYGILNAIYVQQDSVKLLAEVSSGQKLNMQSEIRTLRNRLAGHPAYTGHHGGTSSIPVPMEAGELSFQVYGLSDAEKKDRFYRQDIDELIAQNYAELNPKMEKIYVDLKPHLACVFAAPKP